MRRVKAVLLDMGGVLLDMGDGRALPTGKFDWRGRLELLAVIQERRGSIRLEDLETLLFAPWRREYERRYETLQEASWKPHLRRLRRAAGIRARDLTLLGSWFQPYGESIRPLPGAGEILARLKEEGYRLALVSNVPLPGRLYLRVLQAWRLDSFFDSFHFSYDAGSRKPSPAMVREALERLGAEPREAVMVGDRRATDVAAGRSAGVWTVWLRSHHPGGPAADAEIESLEELPGRVRRGFS